MTIPEVFSEDAGQFMATAKNIAGQASSTAELIVRGTVSLYTENGGGDIVLVIVLHD